MAANAHNELADDEINRSADELKTAISNANVGDKIPAMDRFALDTQEWRSVVLECLEKTGGGIWRLLDEHGEVLDEGPECPGAGFPEDPFLAEVGMTYYVMRQENLHSVHGPRSRYRSGVSRYAVFGIVGF